VQRITRTIARGQGRPEWSLFARRIVEVVVKVGTFAPVFRDRPLVSFFHGLVGWGFIYYLLVNLNDVLVGYIDGFIFLGKGIVGDLFRLGADVLSVAILVGMIFLIVRRFLTPSPELTIRPSTTLDDKARKGIPRDSAIVGVFILIHVGARFLGESFHLGLEGLDAWQPAASALASLWIAGDAQALNFARHLTWWFSVGGIVAFLPYFLYSKHLHLFLAPLNYLLRPERRSMGALPPLDFEDQSIDQFGAGRLEDLSWSALMDAYACIMCNRCQDACPAYGTGKVLSPAALEINKRYFLNREGAQFAVGAEVGEPLTEFAISTEAVWGCTACGACVEVCPVANEPMLDILEIRRHLVLMENDFPEQLQTAYRGMERTANIWSIPPEKRMDWAEGLRVPTVAENPSPDYLWWVGCAPSTDPRAQESARAFATLLNAAQVNFAVLGQEERCTGDAARRSGNEYLFFELASANVETLNRLSPPKIVTTCPHCMHTLKNEYPDFGGEYEVVHHTELIEALIEGGRLTLELGADSLTFHDPCYLGRQNDVIEAPRRSLVQSGFQLTEMPRNRRDSFCCGAGGAQMWKEEEQGQMRVSAARIKEAMATGEKMLAVGCPFCMIMLEDAAGVEEGEIEIQDVAELVASHLRRAKPNTSSGEQGTDPSS
jgi:Fe-S oxidoreductase